MPSPPMNEPVCTFCEEPVPPDEQPDAPMMPPVHRECLIRQVVGSVGHLERRCSCHGGDASDPPEMTRREAARAAVTLWKRSQSR